jgi:LPXTG-site transpeptidase (sortase) family protein
LEYISRGVRFKLFLTFSLVCFAFFAYFLAQRYIPVKISNPSVEVTSEPVISIPSIDISLPIIPARINGTTWETTTKGVSYLSSSANPGEVGNTIMYGHNWPNLLGRLSEVKPGQEILVKRQDGKTLKYIVQFTTEVSASQSDILAPTVDNRLTLYTCTGFWDEKRYVVVAFLVG